MLGLNLLVVGVLLLIEIFNNQSILILSLEVLLERWHLCCLLYEVYMDACVLANYGC